MLSDLSAGTWCIRQKTKQFVTIKRESIETYIKMLRDTLSLTDRQYDEPFAYYINLLKENKDVDPIAVLMDYREKILELVSTSRKKKLQRALTMTMNLMQYIYNKKMDASDVYNDFKYSDSVYRHEIVGKFTGYVAFYKRENKGWTQLFRKYILHDNLDLSGYQPGLYRIDIYDEHMDLLKRYFDNRMPDNEIQEYYNPYREQLVEESRRIDQLLEDTISAPELSDDEKRIYARQLIYSPNNLYLGEPTITEDDFSRLHISIDAHDFESIDTSLYLVAEEADTLFRTDSDFLKRRFKLNSSTLTIDAKDNYFNDEPYYFYIEDENHKKYSYISAYTLPLSDKDDYMSRVRKQLLTNRIQRISTQLTYDLSKDVARAAVLALDTAMHESDTTLYNLIDRAFSTYYKDPYTTNRFDVLRSLYTDKVMHEDTDFTSFPGVIVRPQWHRVEFPYTLPDRYIVERIGFASTGYTKTYYKNVETALTLYYYPEEYVVFSVFSPDTGKRIGGFLMFDNTKRTLTYVTHRLKAVTSYE